MRTEKTAMGPDEQRAAFARHVVPEVDVLYRVALSLSARQADAEDLVQETLLRAFRAMPRFDGRHPRAWLLTIMRNAHLNAVRKRHPELLDDPDDVLRRLRDDSTMGRSPEELVVGEMFDAVVESAFHALPAKLRDVVQLVDVEGRTYAETAKQMNIPIGTVMSRLHRARRQIRDELAAGGLAPGRPGR
jgi:RNA polymerase sigma-70 factor (ECF subfamily)